MGLATGVDMEHTDATHHERVREQSAMAAPPLRLGAHQGEVAIGAEPLDALQAVGELVRGHVVRVTLELLAPPAAVGRTGDRPATAPELGKVDVFDPIRSEQTL